MAKKTYIHPAVTVMEMGSIHCTITSIGIGEGDASEPACAPVRRYTDSFEDEEETEWED